MDGISSFKFSLCESVVGFGALFLSGRWILPRSLRLPPRTFTSSDVILESKKVYLHISV